MVPAGNRGLMFALAGIALLLIASLAAYRLPTPLGANASPDAFSAHRAKATLEDLVGDGIPHPIGSPAGVRMREGIVRRLSALGYAPQLQSGFVCRDGVCGNPVNIIATLGGSTDDRDAVMLAAHYDSVPAGPGASDDGAAVAALLEIARILAARPPPRHPIVLLLTDGEEAGLLGATLFVQQHPLSKQVQAAVNMEARGTSGPSLMFETGTANAWLMGLYGSAVARPITNSLYYVVYKQLPNDTDFTVFKAAAYQGFNFAFIGDVGRYHTPLDNVANASPSSIQHQGDNALATLSALANSPTLHPPIAESVFFDGFARGLIAWPVSLTVPAALLSLLLLLAETAILLRLGAVAPREILWGGVGTIGMLVSGGALCSGLLAVGIAVGRVPPMDGGSWLPQPLPMHVAAAAIALLAAGGASHWLARRAGFWGFWTAAALLSAVLSVASAVVIPGASFLPLLGAVAAGLGALPAMLGLVRSRARARSADVAVLSPALVNLAAVLPAFVTFAALFPLLQFLYPALGSLAWPVSTLVLGLEAATLLPLLAAACGRARRQVIAVAALFTVGGALLSFGLPTYSADWPERVSLEYWWDADTGQSHYLARCDSMRLPAALAAAAHFDPVPRPRFAGSGSLSFYAAAPSLELPAPELELATQPAAVSQPAVSRPAVAQSEPASPAAASAAHYQLRLRSPRGAPEALVVFPASAHVSDIALATASGPARTQLARLRSGATLLDIVSLPAAGVEFSVDAAGPMTVQVFDQSYDFPQGGTLQRARPPNAVSSQDGDLTVVHRTVSLHPTADR